MANYKYHINIDPTTDEGKKILAKQKQKSKYIAIGFIIFIVFMIFGMVMLYNKGLAEQASMMGRGLDKQSAMRERGLAEQAAMRERGLANMTSS